MVVINGVKKMDTAGSSLQEYLSDAGYNNARIAVECDGGVISREDYDKKTILDGEIIEIVSFVGGG